MSFARLDDRWLWLGVGIFFFAAVKGIRYALTDIVRLTELDGDQFPANEADKEGEPEDGIPLSTLRMLYLSPNPSISTAAQSLIIKRFAATPAAKQLLTKDFASTNPRTQQLARQATQYLCEWDWDLRDNLLPNDIPPEYTDLDDAEETIDTVEEIDRLIAQDRQHVGGRMGREEEEGEGTIVSRLEELSAEIERGSQGTAVFAGWDRIPAQRPVFNAANEAERRRRRREAMVFHEGEGVIEEADIFRPSRR